jgi:hypothetical protein
MGYGVMGYFDDEVPEKVRELIRQLEQFTEVRIKDNLDRILKVKA